MINPELADQLKKLDIVCISKPLKKNETERTFEDFAYTDVLLGTDIIEFKVHKDCLSFEGILKISIEHIKRAEYFRGLKTGRQTLAEDFKTLLNL